MITAGHPCSRQQPSDWAARRWLLLALLLIVHWTASLPTDFHGWNSSAEGIVASPLNRAESPSLTPRLMPRNMNAETASDFSPPAVCILCGPEPEAVLRATAAVARPAELAPVSTFAVVETSAAARHAFRARAPPVTA